MTRWSWVELPVKDRYIIITGGIKDYPVEHPYRSVPVDSVGVPVGHSQKPTASGGHEVVRHPPGRLKYKAVSS